MIRILKEMHSLHTTSACNQSEVKRDIGLAVAILNNISTMKDRDEILNELLVPVRTDDENVLCMKPIQEVTYCDKEWYQRSFEFQDLLDKDVHLVHPLLSPETAETLKIHGVISRVLAAEELGFESYGQFEGLTTRLNSILKDYTDGMAVLKELVQNADDAGATEVKFLYDQRQNKDSRTLLFDRGMAELQGPALWAHNNAVFTRQDFENLVKLSGATKEEKNEKIGRFGLGFNAVYNLTDVPSLVSQNHAVFLDPHAKYLGRAIRDKSKPGIKIDIKDSRRKLQALKDQFGPYDRIFGFNLSKDAGGDIATNSSRKEFYPGTLFRFPLRTAQQADTSEICKKCYSHQELMTLLELLGRSGQHLLLFTQNVSKISVLHLPDNASPDNIEEWFTIEKSLAQTMRSLNRNSLCLLNDPSELTRECSILKVASSFLKPSAYAGGNEMPKIESSVIIKVVCQTTEKFPSFPAAATVLDKEVSESFWLVASCLGRGASLTMARSYNDLIPVGGMAAKLSKIDVGRYEPINLEDSGLVFCFLPLPIRSCFPVHINGSFALTSSRTHIYENTVEDKLDRRSQWNETLVKDAIAEVYLVLLEDLLTVCPNCNSYALWPTHKSLKEAGWFSMLTDALYRRIFDKELKIVRENGRLLSMSECRYLEPSFRMDTVGETALSVCRTMASLDFHVTDLPLGVYKTATETSAAQQLEARKITKSEFFERFFLPNIHTVEAAQRDQLTLYALFDQSLIRLLQNVACIPVKPRHILKACDQLVHPDSFLAVLFDEEDDCFPDFNAISGFRFSDIYGKLIELGMRERDLPWKEIAERCRVVTKSEDLVAKRLEAIVKLMSSKASSVAGVDCSFVEQIKAIPFLPTAMKPIGFPLRWKGDDLKYASCNESFLSNVKHLVCCLYPIVNDHKIFGYDNQRLKVLLGLADRQIQQSDLLLQFEEVLQSSESTKGLPVDGATHVREICAELYRQFEGLAGRNELLQTTIDKLSNMQIILVDGSMTFMSPRNCALTLGVPLDSLLPYLAQVPRSMTNMRYLLDKLQIKQRFQLVDYVSVLQQVHTKSQDEPLKPDELQMVLCIVNNCLVSEIANFPADSGELSLDQSETYVPDAKGILHPIKSLCYNNCPWIKDISDHHFCSDGIAPKAAMSIGMKTIREDVIIRHSIGIPFGQREKLVSRIRRILSGYPFDKEVLKEMLQNADDARATAIHFINDRRQLETERLFEDRWKPLQGPALCIFNDKPFTKEDIVGIQNLGEGSKSEDPTKTGQYGVGFNCVYHVTEAPTFLTNVVADDGDGVERVLCAFDPTLKFVPGAEEESPGRMMNDIDELKKKFPDVFEGYFETHYGSLGGTMFRLSLRDRNIAERPGCVTNKAVTSADIDALFATFKTDMYESLLFLNSVEEIHLRNSCPDGNLTTEYVVRVEMTAEAKEKRMQFSEKVASLSKALRANEISLKNIGLTEISYELVTKDDDGQKDTWLVVQRFGFEDPGCVPEPLSDAYARGDIGLLPRCGVAHLKSTTRKKVVDRDKRRLFCFLPLPIPVSFPSHINGHFALDYEARRNLWSDEKGGYKTEWNKCMMSHLVAPCYCSLLLEERDSITREGPVTQAAVYRYNSLFPSIDSAGGSYMNVLTNAIYERIATKNLAVFPTRWPAEENLHLWIGPRGMDESTWKMWSDMGWNGPAGTNGILGYFDDLYSQILEPPEPSGLGYRHGLYMTAGNVVKTEPKKMKHEIVREILVASGFLLINCPVSIARNFTKTQAEVKPVSPDAVLSFFSTYGQPNGLCRLQALPRHLNETLFKDVKTMKLLVEYCTGCDGFKGRLLDLPFLLTADHHLRCFDREAVKYEPRFSETVPHIRHQFIDKGIFHAMRLDAKVDKLLCRAFTVEEFAMALPSLLPPDKFKTVEEFVSMQTLRDTLKDNDLKWLVHLWTFLYKCQQEQQEQASQARSNQAIESLKNTILPLSDWCLLPVSFRRQECLFPMQRSRSVINFSRQVLQETLNTCLHKIGIPQPLFKYFLSSCVYPIESESLKMYYQLLGTADDAASVVLALEEVVKCGVVEAKLSSSECEELCKYLAKSLDSWKDIPNSIDTVRQLPIFTTMYRKQVALLNSCVYVIPSCIPTVDMESWTGKRGIIFLRQNADFLTLFKFLGCTILSETEVYCGYIFKHFEMLSRCGQEVHLMYVRDCLLVNLSKSPYKETAEHQQKRIQAFDALMESLRTLAFIVRGDGSYARAAEFFDNQNEVFVSMQEPSDFPPEPYNSPDWNDFLKKCGMISVVSQTLFLDYARQIEHKSQIKIDADLRKQSSILVNHLFSRDDLKDATFMNSVKIIKFFEPLTLGDDRNTLHDGCGKKSENGQNMFICFKNSIIPEHADVIWTVQNVIPYSIYTYSYTLGTQPLKGLEVELRAKPEKVAEHVRRLCTKWESAVHRLEPHAEVMAAVLKKCYAIFKSSLSADSTAILKILKESPCIFDSKKCLLVRPEQVVLRWNPNKEINPYLIRNPDELGEFVEVFTLLESSLDDATIEQYCMVLEMIHTKTQKDKLDPNEKEAVCKATRGFFKHLKRTKELVTLKRELFLPGIDERLHPSSEIIVNNSDRHRDRIESFDRTFLIDLQECKLRWSEHELESNFGKLPADCQPQFLTSVVLETLDDDFITEDSSFVRMLETKLQSDQLTQGITRIAVHCANTHEKDDEERIREAIERLEDIQFVGVNSVHTYLVYQGKRIEGSERKDQLFHTTEELVEGHRRYTFFIRSTPMEQHHACAVSALHRKLACSIQRVLKPIMHYDAISFLADIIRCDDIMTIGVMLDMLDIKRIKWLQNLERKFRPLPGQFVPIHLHHLLKQDILLLKINDYVALETDDPVDNVDSFAEEEPPVNPTGGDVETDDGSSMQPTYILVKILDVFDKENGPFAATYRIEDGNGAKTVSAALLYAFHRTVTDVQDVNAILEIDGPEPNVTVTLDEAKREIRQTLLDTWNLRKDIQRKFIKRLLLKWHPDKRPNDTQIATEATKYIFELIDKLSKGIPIDDEVMPSVPRSNGSSASYNYPSGDYYSGAYYSYMTRRVKKHQMAQQKFRENYERNTENADERRRRDFVDSFSFVSRNPQPGEGHRWLRQADCDLRCVANDGIDGKCPSAEWACFKCYQAAEKAVRSAQYARDSNAVVGKDISEMAEMFKTSELHEWVRELLQLVRGPSYMQYPTEHHQPKIPHDAFGQETVQRTRVLSQNIVDWCRKYIG